LIKPEFWSVDPYARIYPISFGYKLPMTMLGSQVSEVIESRNPRFPSGSHVLAYTGWRELAVVKHLIYYMVNTSTPSWLQNYTNIYFKTLNCPEVKKEFGGKCSNISIMARAITSYQPRSRNMTLVFTRRWTPTLSMIPMAKVFFHS